MRKQPEARAVTSQKPGPPPWQPGERGGGQGAARAAYKLPSRNTESQKQAGELTQRELEGWEGQGARWSACMPPRLPA